MKNFMAVLLCASLVACQTPEPTPESVDVAPVDSVLNRWHRAASQADFEGYFDYFASDSSIFMGTDETERWTVAKFAPWAKPYFDRGQGWTFHSTFRKVYYSSDSTFSWFDETLSSTGLGPLRGSGVLRLTPNGWKIEHYNLTLPIPNDVVGDVVERIKAYHDTLTQP